MGGQKDLFMQERDHNQELGSPGEGNLQLRFLSLTSLLHVSLLLWDESSLVFPVLKLHQLLLGFQDFRS